MHLTREIIGMDVGTSEDGAFWLAFLRSLSARSLSEKQCSKRYASLVECKDANYSTTKSRLL